MTGSVTNIDDKIASSMNEQMGIKQEPLPPDLSNPTPEEPEQLQEAAELEPVEQFVAEPEKEINPDNSKVDEYGNEVVPPKTYTEEDVQRMIRDRLSRGRHAEQAPTQQQIQQASDDFKSDPNSEESWETQLESFVERTIEKRQAKQNEAQWRQQEAAKQAEFESKFSSGMNKYGDFHKVVQPLVEQGKLTDPMILATRGLSDPAAFVYAASKLHPQELDRISHIQDSYAQASEIGRLHERMVKSRNAVSNAPKPLETPKGDLPNKGSEKPNIDYLIQKHAQEKRSKR